MSWSNAGALRPSCPGARVSPNNCAPSHTQRLIELAHGFPVTTVHRLANNPPPGGGVGVFRDRMSTRRPNASYRYSSKTPFPMFEFT